MDTPKQVAVIPLDDWRKFTGELIRQALNDSSQPGADPARWRADIIRVLDIEALVKTGTPPE